MVFFLQRLRYIGFSNTVLKWFLNYLTRRTQCVSIGNYNSTPSNSKGRCSPRVYFGTNFIFCLFKWEPANVHFYADDTIIYTMALSVKVAMDSLQTAFHLFQTSLVNLKLVLNTKKDKKIWFFTCFRLTPNDFMIKTSDGTHLERIYSHHQARYQEMSKLAFGIHIDSL